MKRLACALSVVSIAAACGGTTSTATVAPGSDAGSPTDAGSPVDSGGSEASTDSGLVVPDAGTGVDSGLPPSAPIQFDNCAAFTACGGDPTGTWDYTGACVDSSVLLAKLAAACQGTEAPTVNSATGTVQGRITFTATTVTRDVKTSTAADVDIAKTCFPMQAQGFPCATLGLALATKLPGASCKDGTDSAHCDCNVTITGGTSGANGYTVSGTQLDLDDGSVYDFCVNGTQLQYQQTTAAMGGTIEPGVSTTTKE